MLDLNTPRSDTPSGSPLSARSPQWATVGDRYDNALAESIVGVYKTERVKIGGPLRNADERELATLSWVACVEQIVRVDQPVTTSRNDKALMKVASHPGFLSGCAPPARPSYRGCSNVLSYRSVAMRRNRRGGDPAISPP
jgi:hypothetical protein